MNRLSVKRARALQVISVASPSRYHTMAAATMDNATITRTADKIYSAVSE